jgi:hypothetical protein
VGSLVAAWSLQKATLVALFRVMDHQRRAERRQ